MNGLFAANSIKNKFFNYVGVGYELPCPSNPINQSLPSFLQLFINKSILFNGWLSELANKKRRMNKKDEMEDGGRASWNGILSR